MSKQKNDWLRFEHFIKDMFKDLGKMGVKHDEKIDVSSTKSDFGYRQIDVMYGLNIMLDPRLVECKFKENKYEAGKRKDYQRFEGNKVTYDEVGDFVDKLYELNGKNKLWQCRYKGVIITNSTGLVKDGIELAKKERIKVITRQKLQKMDYKRMGALNQMRYLMKTLPTLEERIRNYEV